MFYHREQFWCDEREPYLGCCVDAWINEWVESRTKSKQERVVIKYLKAVNIKQRERQGNNRLSRAIFLFRHHTMYTNAFWLWGPPGESQQLWPGSLAVPPRNAHFQQPSCLWHPAQVQGGWTNTTHFSLLEWANADKNGVAGVSPTAFHA